MKYLHNLKVPPHKILIDCKVKKGNFTEEKLGTHHSNEVFTVNITSNGANQNCVLLDRMQEEHNITCITFLPKIHNLSLFMRKYQRNQNWGTLQNKWPKIFKNATVRKVKERLRNCFGLTENKETWSLNAMCDPGWNPFVIKDIETVGETCMGCVN